LRLRQQFIPPKLEHSEMPLKPDQRKLMPEERVVARQLIAAGKSLCQVAAHYKVSRMTIWRLMESHPRQDAQRARGGDA
jgi:hypothetical protein